MGSKIYESDYRGSVSLTDLDGNRFFGYVEELSIDYIILRLLEEKYCKNILLSMYPHYYDNEGYIKKLCFKDIQISQIANIAKGVYKFKLLNLSEEQKSFLEMYSKFSYVEKCIHKSNEGELNFELALNIVNPKIEKLWSHYKIKDIYNSIKEKNNLKDTIFNKLSPSRVYFGNEFCPRLLPTVKQINDVLKKVDKENLELTFLTPTLYQEDTNKFVSIINEIDKYGEEHNKKIEVVFNNWGTFQLMKDKNYIKPVVGRLLSKFKRDPRFSYNTNEIFKECNTDLRLGDLSTEVYKNFLMKNNLNQVEVDCLPQGIPLDLCKEDDIGINLHFPFYVATSSRICLLGSLGRDFNTMFDFKQPCQLECRKYYYDVAFWDQFLLDGDIDAKRIGGIVKDRALFGSINDWKENFDFELAYNRNIKRLVYYHEPPY